MPCRLSSSLADPGAPYSRLCFAPIMPVDSKPNISAVQEFLAAREAQGRTMHSRRSGDGLALFSYDEPIAFRESNRCILVELEWKYSRTTDRHRRLLMNLAAEASVKTREVTREEVRGLAGLNPAAPPQPLPSFPASAQRHRGWVETPRVPTVNAYQVEEVSCGNCGRASMTEESFDDEWRGETDATGALMMFCPDCWRREFGSTYAE